MDEFDLIRRYFNFNRDSSAAKKPPHNIIVDIGDDGAVVRTPTDKNLVISSDTLVEKVHFFSDMNAAHLAQKALAVSLSDLAAMAAKPRWMTITLTAPALPEAWFAAFARGCIASTQQYDYAIIGGDLTRGSAISITTTAIGSSNTAPLTRGGACDGDDIWLSAPIGEAAYAVDLLKQKNKNNETDELLVALKQRLEQPTPRVQLGQELASIANAAIDLSDGVLLSSTLIAQQSKARCVLWAEQFPIAETMRSLHTTAPDSFLHYVFSGGDDYELLWTAAAAHRHHIANNLSLHPHRVGIVQAANNPSNYETILYKNANSSDIIPISNRGYEHHF